MTISKKNMRIAEDLKALGHAVRLQILEELLKDKGEYNVSSIQKVVKISQSALSQHLALLKNKGFVVSKTNGVERIYSIKDAKTRKFIQSILSL